MNLEIETYIIDEDIKFDMISVQYEHNKFALLINAFREGETSDHYQIGLIKWTGKVHETYLYAYGNEADVYPEHPHIQSICDIIRDTYKKYPVLGSPIHNIQNLIQSSIGEFIAATEQIEPITPIGELPGARQ